MHGGRRGRGRDNTRDLVMKVRTVGGPFLRREMGLGLSDGSWGAENLSLPHPSSFLRCSATSVPSRA